METEYNTIWHYHQGTSQEYALSIAANDILYCGTRGPGKTDTQLMRFRRNVGIGYGSFWRGIIYDREYKNLDDLVIKSKRWFLPLQDGAQWLASNSDYKWRWPTGEELLFRQVKKLDDYWQYHGHEYPFIGWNELTKYATPELYEMMFSVNRTGFDPIQHTPRVTGEMLKEWEKYKLVHDYKLNDYYTPDRKPLPPIPLEVFSTCNPLGPGHNWVKRRFIDIGPYGKVQRKTYNITNPKTRKEETITRTQVAIFGSYKENPNLTPEYIAGLQSSDENRNKAWLNGDWDIVAGGALDDVWKRPIHVIPRFRIPRGWYVDRALDWGSSHPFSIGWFAEANGEEVELPDGTKICPQPGTIIQIAEIYGTTEIGTNKGVKWSAKKVAETIKEMETILIRDKWITNKPYAGPADNQIAEVRETTTDTIEKKMSDEGITWERSDKGPGSRKNGLQLIRDRLEATANREGPGLLFMDNCTASISTIPVLPRDDKLIDDVDTSAEDHAYDMVRYRVLKGNNRTATVIHVNFPR